MYKQDTDLPSGLLKYTGSICVEHPNDTCRVSIARKDVCARADARESGYVQELQPIDPPKITHNSIDPPRITHNSVEKYANNQ